MHAEDDFDLSRFGFLDRMYDDLDVFDLREWLLRLTNPDEQAKAILESGWAGHPDIADIERGESQPVGYPYRDVLAHMLARCQSAPLCRSSDLSGLEVVRLYNAVAYLNWSRGVILNCHIVIVWNTLGIDNHQEATRLLGKYLNACQKWARVGTAGIPRQRRRARTGEGFSFPYIYTCECSGQAGFHSHILCRIPKATLAAFRAWSRSILRRLAGHYGNEYTIKVVASQEQDESGAVQRQWAWFRYLSKQLREDTLFAFFVDEAWHPLRTILKPWPHRQSLPVTCNKLSGYSLNLGPHAQRAAGFQSRLCWDNRETIYTGHELAVWHAAELERRWAPILDIGRDMPLDE
jgi:hypothetical protein